MASKSFAWPQTSIGSARLSNPAIDLTQREQVRWLEAGAKSYLTKPLTVQKFIVVLDRTQKTRDSANAQ